MKYTYIILLLTSSLVLLSSSCKDKKNMADSENKTEMKNTDVNSETNPGKLVIVDKEYRIKETDSFKLIESNLDGDILSLLVEYGGGCEDHEWEMYSNGFYAKSLPPQITVNLEHNANNDNCRALLRDTLEFDLRLIRYSGHNELIVKLNNYPEHRIKYRYEK